MKTEVVGTFHLGIWPDPDDDDDDGNGGDDNDNSMMPTVITKATMDKTKGTDRLASQEDKDLPPLPKRVHELVALRRKRFDQT